MVEKVYSLDMYNENKGVINLPLWEKILLLFVVFISISSLFVVSFRYVERESHMHTNKSSDNTAILRQTGSDGTFVLVSRNSWGARNPRFHSPRLIQPGYVIIGHTNDLGCYGQGQCASRVRAIQRLHMISREWNDIGWNFLVGGDGKVYDGRGWEAIGMHTLNYDHKSIGVAFIGNFDREIPTYVQLKAAKNLLDYGVRIGRIHKDYKLLGQSQCAVTESPGRNLYSIIKIWDHWSEFP